MHRPEWRAYPTVAIDLVVLALQHVVPIAVASKLFLLSLVALIHGGAHVLGRTIYALPTWLPPAVGYFSYSPFLVSRFANFPSPPASLPFSFPPCLPPS